MAPVALDPFDEPDEPVLVRRTPGFIEDFGTLEPAELAFPPPPEVTDSEPWGVWTSFEKLTSGKTVGRRGTKREEYDNSQSNDIADNSQMSRGESSHVNWMVYSILLSITPHT